MSVLRFAQFGLIACRMFHNADTATSGGTAEKAPKAKKEKAPKAPKAVKPPKPPKVDRDSIKAPAATRLTDSLPMIDEARKDLIGEFRKFWVIEGHDGIYNFDKNIQLPENAEAHRVAAKAPSGLAQFKRATDVEKAVAKMTKLIVGG